MHSKLILPCFFFSTVGYYCTVIEVINYYRHRAAFGCWLRYKQHDISFATFIYYSIKRYQSISLHDRLVLLSASDVAIVYMLYIIRRLIDIILSNTKSKKSCSNYFVNLKTSFKQKYF